MILKFICMYKVSYTIGGADLVFSVMNDLILMKRVKMNPSLSTHTSVAGPSLHSSPLSLYILYHPQYLSLVLLSSLLSA